MHLIDCWIRLRFSSTCFNFCPLISTYKKFFIKNVYSIGPIHCTEYNSFFFFFNFKIIDTITYIYDKNVNRSSVLKCTKYLALVVRDFSLPYWSTFALVLIRTFERNRTSDSNPPKVRDAF